MPEDPDDDLSADEGDGARTPLDALESLAAVDADLAPGLRHIEIYTMSGLLALFWHGPADASDVVIACGGAMGGVLGPAEGLYHHLAGRLADEHGIATIRVGYRRPNDLARCVHDLTAAADLATRCGAVRFVTMGHSFGGAPALNAAIVLGETCAGVVTLATQSAGCEHGDRLGETPLLLLHGANDEILPVQASQVVQMIAGGELVVYPGAGHLLTEARAEIEELLERWIPEQFAAHAAGRVPAP